MEQKAQEDISTEFSALIKLIAKNFMILIEAYPIKLREGELC